MGEYAKRKTDNVRVKIGTCESMDYLRYEDIEKVDYKGSFLNCIFRLPFLDEDNVPIGEYENYNRSAELINLQLSDKEIENLSAPYCKGNIQCWHESGLLTNISCYHGLKLPEDSKDAKFHWNGKHPNNFVLSGIKYTKDKLIPVIKCKWCKTAWRMEGEDDLLRILNCMSDKELSCRIFNCITWDNYNKTKNISNQMKSIDEIIQNLKIVEFKYKSQWDIKIKLSIYPKLAAIIKCKDVPTCKKIKQDLDAAAGCHVTCEYLLY